MGIQATKIKVIIASKNSLITSGIQAYINQCGYYVEYLHFESLQDVLINQNFSHYYLIIYQQLIPEDIEHLTKEYQGKIMMLGNSRSDQSLFIPTIFQDDSDKVILEKLEDFFVEESPNADVNNNDVLSSREIEILKEVALGYSNKEIADRLFISINTVITHRKNITDKLGIKTIAGLTVYALMNKLINPNDVTI